MPNNYRNPKFTQPLDIITIGNITTLNMVAKIVKNLGNAAHAYPADAHKVDSTDV